MNGPTYTGEGKCNFVSDQTLDQFHPLAPKWVEIGDHVTVSNRVMILVHDAMAKNHDGRAKFGKVVLEDYTSISFGAILLPGVRVGFGSIVAAGSVVYGGTQIPPMEVWGGNPAHKIIGVMEFLRRRAARQTLDEYKIDYGVDDIQGVVTTTPCEDKGFWRALEAFKARTGWCEPT